MHEPPVEVSVFSTPDHPPSPIQSIGITPWPDGNLSQEMVPSWNFSLGPEKSAKSPYILPLEEEEEEVEVDWEAEDEEEALDFVAEEEVTEVLDGVAEEVEASLDVWVASSVDEEEIEVVFGAEETEVVSGAEETGEDDAP